MFLYLYRHNHLGSPITPSRDQPEWNQISNNVKPGGNFVVLDLEPATWYNLRITAHNSAGFTVAEYEFATLTITGGKLSRVHFCRLILLMILVACREGQR